MVDEEYLKYARENSIPVDLGTAVTVAPKMSFKQKLAKFLSEVNTSKTYHLYKIL